MAANQARGASADPARPAAGPQRFLGVDPGLRFTGWGVVEQGRDGVLRCLGHGVVAPPPKDPMELRLAAIHRGLADAIAAHGVTCAAVEQTFVAVNARSALQLGQARGAAMAALGAAGLEVASYAPKVVKLALTGSGRAEKAQVAAMVMRLLSLREEPSEDAADALAVAICHLHSRANERRRQRMEAAR